MEIGTCVLVPPIDSASGMVDAIISHSKSCYDKVILPAKIIITNTRIIKSHSKKMAGMILIFVQAV